MLQAKQVRFGYGNAPLFLDVNLTLAPGRIYGLLGLNGAGKSTLLRLMTGLLFPQAGRIEMHGFNPRRRDPAFLSKVFMLPEKLNLPAVTGREFVRVRSPFHPRFDHSQMQRCLEEFEISAGSRLTALSQGQQKKFLLAFGLACKASLVLLDEPTNGLDIPSKSLFRRLVAEAVDEERAIVVSTHQVRDVESLVDQIVILHGGQVLLNRSLAELSANLRFRVSSSQPEGGDDLIYAERTLGGHASVWRQKGADDERLDLELLFKAVISDPAACAAWFGREARP